MVNTGTCASTGACPNLGTVTFTFSQPVRNPIIHLAGLGGAIKNGNNQSDLHSVWDLTTAGVTISKLDGNAQLAVTGGTRVTAANDSTSASCTTVVNGGGLFDAAATAACGSVQVNGTVTQVAFNMSAVFVKNPIGHRPQQLRHQRRRRFGRGDASPGLFGRARRATTRRRRPPTRSSDLTLGATVDEDNANTRNSATSAFRVGRPPMGTTPTGADDEDAFTTLPSFSTQSGVTYSLNVPISGLSKAANLCGWIDFDGNGTFDAGERACATPAAGATSATLTWTTPSGMTVRHHLRAVPARLHRRPGAVPDRVRRLRRGRGLPGRHRRPTPDRAPQDHARRAPAARSRSRSATPSRRPARSPPPPPGHPPRSTATPARPAPRPTPWPTRTRP